MRTSDDLKKYTENASPEDIDDIKTAIFLLEASRHAGYQLYHQILDSDVFSEKIIKPLEKLVGWDEKDIEQAKLKVEELTLSVRGKTMKERRESSGKLFKEIFKLVAVGAAGFMAGRLSKDENKKDA